MKNSLKITIPVTNTGSVAGAEVVQLYIADKEASVDRPVKELKGFEKVWLEPGETKNVEFTIDRSALSFYDESSKSWVAESGAFEVLVGAASDDIRSTAEFNLR